MESDEDGSASFLVSVVAGVYFVLVHLFFLYTSHESGPDILLRIRLWFSPLLFVLSAFFWWLLIERTKTVDWVRGGIVGLLSGLIYYFSIGLITGPPTWGAYTVVYWFLAIAFVPLLVLAGVIAAISKKWFKNSKISPEV